MYNVGLMRRYEFLTKEGVYEALNKLRAAFLAAKDGHQVEEIIMGVLTHDERMKIGRRVQIAKLLRAGWTQAEIAEELKVGFPTISLVARKLQERPGCYDLIEKREDKVENKYRSDSYRSSGGSKLVFKKKVYTGFTRKDVTR